MSANTIKKKQVFLLSLSIFLISLIAFDISFLTSARLPIDTLFWTFSTVAQALLALIAFVGVLAIFRLQAVSSELASFCENIRSQVKNFEGTADTYTHKEIIEACKKWAEKNNEDHLGSVVQLTDIRRITPKIKDLEIKLGYIKERILNFALVVIITTATALIFLPLAPLLNIIYLNYSALVIVIILSLWVLYLAYSLTKSLLVS